MGIDINEINNFSSKNIIDLRSKDDYKRWHLNGSMSISYNYLLINPTKYMNKNEKYLLVCDYGIMSKKVCEILKKQGYNVFSLRSGIKKYQEKF